MKTLMVTLLILQGAFLFPSDVIADEVLITNHNTYNLTKKTWVHAYKYTTQNGSAVKGMTYIAPLMGNGWKDRLHKNGARDTIIFVPEKTNFEEAIDIIIYFHGHGGFKERDFKTRVLRHTKSLQEEERNFIIIIPEMPWSKNTSTPRKRNGRVFTGKKQFATFINSAIKVVVTLFDPSPVRQNQCAVHNLCHFNFGNAVLIGHSAGGSTLMSISKSGGLNWLYDGKNRKALSIQIVFSDAGYGRWTDITWKHFKFRRSASVEFTLLTRKWDRPYNNTKRFLKRFRIIPRSVRHIAFDRKTITHAGIGDQAFKWLYLLSGSGCGEGEGK